MWITCQIMMVSSITDMLIWIDTQTLDERFCFYTFAGKGTHYPKKKQASSL